MERQVKEDKVLPGINFDITFKVNFSISTLPSLRSEFKTFIEKNNLDGSKVCRKWVFDHFDVKNIRELITKNAAIRKAVLNVKDIVKDEIGYEEKYFSEWGVGRIKEELKNGGTKTKK